MVTAPLCLSGASFLSNKGITFSPARFQLTVEVFDYMDTELRLAETGENKNSSHLVPILLFQTGETWATVKSCCLLTSFIQAQKVYQERVIVSSSRPASFHITVDHFVWNAFSLTGSSLNSCLRVFVWSFVYWWGSSCNYNTLKWFPPVWQ